MLVRRGKPTMASIQPYQAIRNVRYKSRLCMSVVLLVKEKIGPRSLGVILGDGMIEDEDDGYCYVCNVTTSSQLPFSMDNFGRRQRRASAETGGRSLDAHGAEKRRAANDMHLEVLVPDVPS